MKQPLRWLGYAGLGGIAFAIFLYWSFPYDIVKERLVTAIEQQLGGGIEVAVESLQPSWFTGVKLSNVDFSTRTGAGLKPLWHAERVKIRLGLFSLLFGQPKVRFAVKSASSYIGGIFQQMENGFQLELDMDPFDIAELAYLKAATALAISGTITGGLKIQLNPSQIGQAQGQIDLAFKEWKVKAQSKIPAGQGEHVELKEDLVLSKGSDSVFKGSVSKGTLEIGAFKFTKGDVEIDLKGEVFLAPKFANSRFNLMGQIKTTPAAERIPPFIYFQEKWRQSDGSYPMVITGNFGGKPQIRIADYLLPM